MKRLVIGIASGVLLSLATGAVAASPSVQAILFPSTINIHKGESTVTLGSNYEVLNYNNSVYIPLRAFSESIGSTVKYTEPNQGTLPQIDVYTATWPWRSTFLGAGNQEGSPLFVRLFSAHIPESDSVGFYAQVHNTGKETVLLKPFKVQIEITKVGEQRQLVWSTTVSSTEPDPGDPFTDVIPGADSQNYWGLKSPIIYWDKKDSSGKPVSSGQYIVQIKPVTIEYNTRGQQNSTTQIIEPDMHTLYGIDIP
ncbi:copper amine oxidase N-terminal domain-containing protein [Paenibacillus periandrae]|uniref:copper amine oxidase N-terminal domain-containing protein n=1 Tax=Paenibacillus periandrae TaxID=1761741 RepID=UPI001F097E4E|nr:copper amine oxidase N-terminal domain-containing protein [Paenibacillus periandrae]